jgi:hypothetical protein
VNKKEDAIICACGCAFCYRRRRVEISENFSVSGCLYILKGITYAFFAR